MRWGTVTATVTLALCFLTWLLFPNLPLGIAIILGMACAVVGMLVAEFDLERRS